MASVHSGSWLCLSVAVVALALACGESTQNPQEPLSPTAPSPSSSSSGASINGQVVNSATNLTVAAVGTTLSTPVAGDGLFSLSRIPVNNVQLRFTGPNTNATLPLGTLQEGATISIRVIVNGSSASLEDPDDDEDDDRDEADVEVTGRVSGKSGACPSIRFLAGTRAVETNAATFFRRVTCELLADNQLVEVEGPIVSGLLRAEKVQLENAQGVERRGPVTGRSGSCPSLTFSVGGSGPVFITRATTEFKDLSCTQIVDGLAVRAEGHVQSNGQALAERVRPQ
jgi:Domain of unknown function (DUF5666)